MAGSVSASVYNPPSTSRVTITIPSSISTLEAKVACGQPSSAASICPVWLQSSSIACLPRIINCGCSLSATAFSSLATASGCNSTSVSTSTARSAPIAIAVRRVSWHCATPKETAITSLALTASFRRMASSTAIYSNGCETEIALSAKRNLDYKRECRRSPASSTFVLFVWIKPARNSAHTLFSHFSAYHLRPFRSARRQFPSFLCQLKKTRLRWNNFPTYPFTQRGRHAPLPMRRSIMLPRRFIATLLNITLITFMRTLIRHQSLAFLFLLANAFAALTAYAADTLFVYGPGGPAPAMKEAASAFEKVTGNKVEVTAGPTGQWLTKAKTDADIIYSGSETMMTAFVNALEGQLSHFDVTPLYLRPMAMLVRPGNPKGVKGFKDLLQPGLKILVVNGAGQNGVWEDVAGRKGDIESVKALRKNIVAYTGSSADAKKVWTEQTNIDVWLIWNIWQVSTPKLADVVAIEPEYAIYRDAGVAATNRGV